MQGAWTSRWSDDVLPRAVAVATAIALLVLAWKLLGGLPRLVRSAPAEEHRVQLVYSPRVPYAPPLVPLPSPPVRDPEAASPASRPPPDADAASMAAGAVRAADTAAGVQFYGSDGRVRLPATDSDRWIPTPAPARVPGLGQAPADEAAARALQPPNPVQSRGTRFARDWISDGDVADVAQQEIARAQNRIAEFLFGKDIEHARARPSPEVRYNPVRHERTADLGSEAAGDAYKAAPIDYQPAPGLDGEASRRIREQVAALETAYARCDRARLQRLMQPLLLHLDELQKAETAYARGADPVRAMHMLPNVANGAYDLSRRALWYADRGMAQACSG
ncbi:hypothetical protein [Pseudoxanthomonas suwonensis]|uniref:Transmembrane protein n=1 Tax=Pseudoxanthomonas suwonensis TaxID=314722 RepID=A0A0E3Z1Z3_9GAMM|nr:hypothetical protein [Pseudoxanthomonas suwonensis]AKC87037.1 hypothetical protein WQ53_10075 [Pseudoxanthomonas suwonensis]